MILGAIQTMWNLRRLRNLKRTLYLNSGMVSKSEDPSPTSLHQFQENQWQSIILEVPDIGKTVAEDFYDACKDFRSSTSAENYQWQATDTAAANSMKNGEDKSSSDAWDDFILRSGQGSQHQTDTVKVSPDVSFDAWNGFTSSSIVQGNQLQTRSTSDIEEMTASVGDYSVDAWNDFKSLTSEHQNQQITVGDKNQDDSLGFLGDPICLTAKADHQQIKEIKSPTNDATMEGESTLTIWNDFMGTSFGQDTEQETNHMEVADFRTKSEVHNIADVQDDLMSSSNAGNNFKQISSTKSFDKNRIYIGDDSFDEWNDFTSSSNTSDYKTISKDISVSAWDNFPSFSSQQQASCEQVPGNRTIAEEDLYNSWSDFRSLGNSVDNNLSGSTPASDNKTISDSISTSSTMLNDSQKQTSSPIAPEKKTISGYIALENKMTLEGNNLFNGDNSSVSTSANASDNQLKSSGTAMGNKTTSEYEGSLDDVWTDFTSSMAMQENHLHDDDPFDAWNVFVSSSGQPGNHNLASSSVINLFSSTSNSQDLGFNSHLQPELFSGTFHDHNSSALLDVLPSEAPVLVRVNTEAEGNAEMNQKLKETSNTKSSDAETLISQMHDLSFMLESSLSIPKSQYNIF
ncbi:hypothetical protein Nepgr_013880 [Nepenthes gracilis]|uniref:Dentin sialophosphoprotein-like n=1 Tax=Nepenthes gracilis TaxID=150966 RepID=A0AAD3SJQ0_NEPGR|nr:hypothetical protein Nepgr_013880 [Nepenthes gracilis]